MPLIKRILVVCYLFCGSSLFAQNVGIGTVSPNNSAQLDVQSNSKGFLLPRMSTAERNAIASPALGLLVFDTDKNCFLLFDGATWNALAFVNENKVPLQGRQPLDATANQYFGSKVDISGDYAIVGAKNWSTNNMSNRGAAYIFYKGSGGWLQQAKLTPTDSAANDLYGGNVAIQGDYAVVSSPTKTNGRGKIYIYKRTGTSWGLEGSFTRTGGVTNDNFGFGLDIAINANGVPVVFSGTPYSDLNGTDKGEVSMYIRNNTNGTWSLLQTIQAADVSSADNFGFNITAEGNYVAIAAPYQDAGGTNTGAVYIYLYNGTNYVLQQRLQGNTSGATFGLSIALQGNLIAIGAPMAPLFANTSPAVYVYTRNNTTWTNTSQLYQLNPSQAALNGVFGMSVAINGSRLMIGMPGGIDFPNGTNINYSGIIGTVYLYDHNGTGVYNSPAIRTLQAESPTDGDLFGQSLAINASGIYIIADNRVALANLANVGAVFFGSW
jgi:hypothetical protein